MEILLDAETWVALAFLVFLGLLGYFGVHKMLVKSLDDRSARIKAELDEARRLKDEATALLSEYRRKRGQAEGEAQEIVAAAKSLAEELFPGKRHVFELLYRPQFRRLINDLYRLQ